MRMTWALRRYPLKSSIVLVWYGLLLGWSRRIWILNFADARDFLKYDDLPTRRHRRLIQPPASGKVCPEGYHRAPSSPTALI